MEGIYERDLPPFHLDLMQINILSFLERESFCTKDFLGQEPLIPLP